MANDKPDTLHTLESHLGSTVRDLRIQLGLTISDVAERAGISRGMLSNIENAQTATSLDILEQLANALGVTLARLFRTYNIPTGGAQLVKNGQGMEVVRRGTKSGHAYHLLAYDQGPHKTFEPFLITLQDPGEEFTSFEYPGTEFTHMLEGELEYRVGNETYLLEPGDPLTFRGEIPHRPERMHSAPIWFLSIIHYDAPGTGSSEENT